MTQTATSTLSIPNFKVSHFLFIVSAHQRERPLLTPRHCYGLRRLLLFSHCVNLNIVNLIIHYTEQLPTYLVYNKKKVRNYFRLKIFILWMYKKLIKLPNALRRGFIFVIPAWPVLPQSALLIVWIGWCWSPHQVICSSSAILLNDNRMSYILPAFESESFRQLLLHFDKNQFTRGEIYNKLRLVYWCKNSNRGAISFHIQLEIKPAISVCQLSSCYFINCKFWNS